MNEPVRRCAGCGKKTGKSEFIRVVRLPGGTGEVAFDPELKFEGRSLYFCPKLECFKTLMRRKAPEKLMKQIIPDFIRDNIKSYLSQTERVQMT
ncbi:YlxR family protein [bacterium]|nr:YlxR family protein [bacterium]